MPTSTAAALFALSRERVVDLSDGAHCANTHPSVNTSLSGHCFFRSVGVFGKECISIPECTQRNRAKLILEGNMAKKAKKAKKAKSAVKKTAKKTRKVAKKKK